MPINDVVVVEVNLRPHDVYTPFRWNGSNLWRWVSAFILCVIFYDLLKKESQTLLSFDGGKGILAIITLLALLVLCGLLLFPYLRWRAYFRKSPDLGKTRRYTFTGEGVASVSEHSKSDYRWSAVNEAYESRQTFTITLVTGGAMYIPKRCLASAGDTIRMRNLVRANVRGKCHLRMD